MNLHYDTILQIAIMFQPKRCAFSVSLFISLNKNQHENATYPARKCGEKIYQKQVIKIAAVSFIGYKDKIKAK